MYKRQVVAGALGDNLLEDAVHNVGGALVNGLDVLGALLEQDLLFTAGGGTADLVIGIGLVVLAPAAVHGVGGGHIPGIHAIGCLLYTSRCV